MNDTQNDNGEQPRSEAPNFFSIKKKMTLEELSKTYIEFVLRANDHSKTKTFRELGIDRKTLYRKIAAISRASSECD